MIGLTMRTVVWITTYQFSKQAIDRSDPEFKDERNFRHFFNYQNFVIRIYWKVFSENKHQSFYKLIEYKIYSFLIDIYIYTRYVYNVTDVSFIGVEVFQIFTYIFRYLTIIITLHGFEKYIKVISLLVFRRGF